MKKAAVDPSMLVHEGPARVFDSEEEAQAAILEGKIMAGDVVVIRYEGPRGGPGMREMLSPTATIAGMGLDKEVALITDGRFSGSEPRRLHRPYHPRGRRGRPHRHRQGGRPHQGGHSRKRLDLLIGEKEMKRRMDGFHPKRRRGKRVPRLLCARASGRLSRGALRGGTP